MDMGLFRGVITVLLLAAFLGLCLWAWSSKRREDFEEAARLPLDENEMNKSRNGSKGDGNE